MSNATDQQQSGVPAAQQQVEGQAGGDQSNEWWCNFCGFRTNDPQAYLSHSCKDVLAARGVEVQPTGRNECS